MSDWQPFYFPEITYPVSNQGTDDCILTGIFFEVLSVTNFDGAMELSDLPTSRQRDLCYAIIIDSANPIPQSFQTSVRIPPGDTLNLLVAIGANRSVRARFVLHFEYDRRGRTRSSESEVTIINESELERWYQNGIALERYSYLKVISPEDISTSADNPGTAMIRTLYRKNRPLNVDALRFFGPGGAYFFRADRPPRLPIPSETIPRLKHSKGPAFYIAVGPAYAVQRLTEAEASSLVCDPRLAPPLSDGNGVPVFHGPNEYGACSFADLPEGFAITQVLPGLGLTGINTEIFSQRSFSLLAGSRIKAEYSTLMPWWAIHELVIDTINKYLDVLKDFFDLHGPVFLRIGLVNVKGLIVCELPEEGAFKGCIAAFGRLRKAEYVGGEILEDADPYVWGQHVASGWSYMIAQEAKAERMPRLFSRD